MLYNDRIYVVECTDPIVGFEQLRDQQARVRYHLGDGDTERRRAWTIHGVDDAAAVVVLDERDTTICDGGVAFAFAWPGGGSTLEALLQQFSVASTTTSSAPSSA